MPCPSRPSCLIALVPASLWIAGTASAVDLTVSSVEINQAVQYGTTKLIGDNLTMVRVKVALNGAAATPGVDASLRLTVDGVPLPGPPIFSLNGPITAPVSPNSGNINDTINFIVLPPVSPDVDFTVEVNPGRTVVETNYNNNVLIVSNKNFECRDIVEVAYVPINYTPGGGLPPANMMEPGIGDNFLRAIYHPGEWNYHQSPLPPLLWAQNINQSNSALLNTLHDIRINQLPAAGYPQPNFVFGWLPGNPFSGNGQAISVPGDVAFGNTEPTRFQRTFAHELGHLFGLPHSSATIGTIGVDVEHHLKDTQNIAQLFPTTRYDVMVAGQLTSNAFVNSSTYNTIINSSITQCGGSLAGDVAWPPVLRISGVVQHDARIVDFNPITRIQTAAPTQHDPAGDLLIAAFDAAGNPLSQIAVRTDTTRRLCSGGGAPEALAVDGPFHALVPELINNTPVQRIDLIDAATGRLLASRQRSANPPQVQFEQVVQVGDQPNGLAGKPIDPANALDGMLRVSWTATDPDGDPIQATVLYSPDGQAWLPIAVNLADASFDFDSSSVPAARGEAGGRFRILVTDGFNTSEDESDGGLAVGAGNPPEVYLLSPNTDVSFPQSAPVAFHAAAWDKEDLMLTDAEIAWTSSLDGPLGTGIELIHSDLSVGTHTIALTGTDGDGMATAKQVTVTITPRTVISPDCNDNGVLDSQDIAGGTSLDSNSNGIPDECEASCPSDVTGNLIVDIDDLFAVLGAWGSADPQSDINDSGNVDIDDLFTLLGEWGPCL